jgi:putative intracellular protease/amidase
MQRGLDGRRIALLAAPDADEAELSSVITALEGAGAHVHHVSDADTEEQWHSGMYAALVLLGEPAAAARGRQLVREFLVVDKPVAAYADGAQLLRESGGDLGALTAGADVPVSAFADRLAQQLMRVLEEHQVDEMSEMSFPASDPPSVSPSSVGGGATPGKDAGERTSGMGRGPDSGAGADSR